MAKTLPAAYATKSVAKRHETPTHRTSIGMSRRSHNTHKHGRRKTKIGNVGQGRRR